MQRNVAYLMLIMMLGLIALGLVMLTSTSGVLAPVDMAGVYSNLRKQCVWLVAGGIVCVFLSRYDYQKLLAYSPYLVVFACGLLALCLEPHIGHASHGSPRWIKFGGWTYQPSEFAKLALVLFLSWWMGKHHRRIGEFFKGFFWPLVLTAPLILLVYKQQDFGTTAVMLAILASLFFCAGTNLLYLVPVPILGVVGLVIAVMANPVRLARVTAWWDNFQHPEAGRIIGAGFEQQHQALIALGSGGPFGLGLGNSRQKMYYLPEVNTDFVFPIIGEELGLCITLAVVLAFLILILCSGWITIHAPDPSGVLLGIGLTLMISLQALMNLAVVTSLMPCKGIPLPFISYGGSNLLTCLAAMGILFNLHRQGIYQTQTAPALATQSYSVRM